MPPAQQQPQRQRSTPGLTLGTSTESSNLDIGAKPDTAELVPANEALPIGVIREIANLPKSERKQIIDLTITLSAAQSPDVMTVLADARRRDRGMWIGGGLSLTSIAGAIGLLAVGGPAAAAIVLLSVGAACAGGTFAVITGNTVSPEQFSNMLEAAGKMGKQDNPVATKQIVEQDPAPTKQVEDAARADRASLADWMEINREKG